MLLWSSINEKRFSTSMWNGWLFTNQYLYLSGTTSALDLVSSSVLWGIQSLVSATRTTVDILFLTAASAIWSNTIGLLVLFKDRPIVRDYKQLMDIESELFDVAYFRSKQVNLREAIGWGSLLSQYQDIVKKYQEAWLLKEWTVAPKSSASMLDIIFDLISMNTAMRRFLVVWWSVWEDFLISYRGCMWYKDVKEVKNGWYDYGDCSAVLQFDEDAATQLVEDYAWLWYYWASNLMASNIDSTTTKAKENVEEASDSAEQKIKDWVERLKKLFAWVAEDHFGMDGTGRCNMSDYQMAQLKSYYGNDWTCDSSRTWWWVNMKFSAPAQFNESKVVLEWEKKNESNLFKEIGSMYYRARTASKLNKAVDDFVTAKTTSEKWQAFFELYGSWYTYSPEFDTVFLSELTSIYDSINSSVQQSQWNAIALDMSYQLIEIKWLLDEVDTVMSGADGLKKVLEKIADYQCSE